MTNLETLWMIKSIITRNQTWLGDRWINHPLPVPEQLKILELVDTVFRKRPQNDPDPTEPSCACPDEHPART